MQNFAMSRAAASMRRFQWRLFTFGSDVTPRSARTGRSLLDSISHQVPWRPMTTMPALSEATLESKPKKSRGRARKTKTAVELVAERQEQQRLASQEEAIRLQKGAKPILAQFLRIKEELPDHVILFRMGDFYECFFDDAKIVAEMLKITLGRRYGEYMCGIPHHALNRYLKQVLELNVRIAICEQDINGRKEATPSPSSSVESSESATSKSKNTREKTASTIVRREIRRILTPGTVTDDEFLERSEQNLLVAIASDGKRTKPNYGLAQLDLSTGEVAMAPLGSAKDLEFNLSRFKAKELIMPRSLASLPILVVDEGIRTGALESLDVGRDDGGEVDQHLSTEHMDEVEGIPTSKSDQFDSFHLDVIRCPALGNCCSSFRPDNTFDASSLESVLDEAGSMEEVPINNLSPAERAALVGVLEYGRFVLRGKVPHVSMCERNDFSSSKLSAMEIDPAALKSLEITQTITGRKRGSLLHTMDRTITPGGSRLLGNGLRTPFVEKERIEGRLNAVDFLKSSLEARHVIQEHLRNISDPHRSLQRIVDSTWLKRDLAVLAIMLDRAGKLADDLEHIFHTEAEIHQQHSQQHQQRMAPEAPSSLRVSVQRIQELRVQHAKLFSEYRNGIVTDPEVITLFDSEPTKKRRRKNTATSEGVDDGASDEDGNADASKSEEGVLHLVPGDIKVGFSPELDKFRELRSNKRGVVQQMEKSFQEMFGIQRLKVDMRRNGMLYIEVPAKEAEGLPADAGLRKIQELRGRSRYRHPDLVELEVDMLKASEDVSAMESKLAKQFSMRTRDYSSKIREVADALAEIDVINSLATLAEDMNLNRPVLVDEPVAHISQGRHLVVESQSRGTGGGPRSFVPNPVSLSSSADEGSPVWLITGPNMGGKSTYLRQNAHIMILAQLGSFVPAKEATLGIVDRLYCRVGASDELIADRSTFMVEMQETATILRRATKNSFVIVDEIGRGTSTRDGCAIAQSVLEALVDIGCRTLFATHFHQLPALVSPEEDRVELFRMSSVFDPGSNELIYLYEIEEGIADNSYGVHAARLADVPESVLSRTEELLKEFDQQTRLVSDFSSFDSQTKGSRRKPELVNPRSVKVELDFPEHVFEVDPSTWSKLSLPQLDDQLRNLDTKCLSRQDALRALGGVQEFLQALLRPSP